MRFLFKLREDSIYDPRLFAYVYLSNLLNATFKQNSDIVFVAYQNKLNPGIYLKVKLNLAT